MIAAVVACVCTEVVSTPRREAAEGQVVPLTVRRGLPVRVAAPTDLFFRAVLLYRVVHNGTRWRMQVADYAFALLDANEREFVAFHWHSDNPVAFPHLHIGPATQARHAIMSRAHIPTGRVTLEDVLEFAEREFRVEMLNPDWRNVFADTRHRYRERRSWS